jgi:hypothetical protein
MFEMELNIRNLLLEELIAQKGKERLTQLGNFMLAYLEQRLVGADADTQNLKERERITALAYTQPTEAARRLAQKLTAGVHTTDVREAFHWTTLAKTLANPLKNAGFEPLLTYNDILFHYAQGNITQNQGLVRKFQQEKQDIEGRLGINLSLPQGVQTVVVQEPVLLSVSRDFPIMSWGKPLNFSNLDSLLLMFGLIPRNKAEQEIWVKIISQDSSEILPTDLELMILDDQGEVIMTTDTQETSSILLKFTGDKDEKFSIKVLLAGESQTFIISMQVQ